MKEIIVITGASSGFGALAARALAQVREFCGSHPIESDMRNGQFFRKESTMTQLEQVMYTATAHTTRGRDAASRSDRRSFLATLAAAGAFGLVLLAAPCYAQTVPAADAQAFVISPLPAKLRAPAEDKAIRRINVPEEALVDLRRRIAATRWPDRETVTYYDKFAAWTYSGGEPERSLTRDEMLDNISLYWLTNTGTSSSESYWEVWGMSPFNAVDISIPVVVTVFPGEIYRAPRSWGERNYHKLIYWHEVDKGGHFAALEQPELFAAEIRVAFKSLR
jgi:pimeloyl-ACP methyl ester carboxylesterase